VHESNGKLRGHWFEKTSEKTKPRLRDYPDVPLPSSLASLNSSRVLPGYIGILHAGGSIYQRSSYAHHFSFAVDISVRGIENNADTAEVTMI
jgi:hypothetical protein